MRANDRIIFQYETIVTYKKCKTWLVPTFCLWHMFAVAVFVIPISYPGGMGGVGQRLHDFSAPYVLSLSQWQQWNLFAPDPIRRVSAYTIDSEVNGVWNPSTIIDPHARRFYEYAKLMKVLGRLETTHAVLVEPFLRSYCIETGLKRLRLRIDSYVLPNDLLSLTRLNVASLPRTQNIPGSIDCSSRTQP